ncbi:adenosine kinase-like [Aphis craccivora]|uniref:Adenosine kinase-like n=1 Tax=Aphis craccivora TaxID=307492 RepID=A0A6G0YF51_APHCR|nr:adenosine kinase-like [Aphis craccivora]
MGNSVVRQTVFRSSWWTKDCRRDVQVEAIAEPLEERRERGAVGKNSIGGGDGRETLVVHRGLDDAVGHQLVGAYLTEWYNAPENVWSYYTEDGVCSLDIDGTRRVATGWTEIRQLFDDVAAPETGHHEGDDGECRSLVVKSIIVTVRCPSGKLLVVATTECFTQHFVVEYKAPDAVVAGVASVAVIASVVTVNGVGAYPQTPAETPIRRHRCRGRGKDSAVDSTATGTCGRPPA